MSEPEPGQQQDHDEQSEAPVWPHSNPWLAVIALNLEAEVGVAFHLGETAEGHPEAQQWEGDVDEDGVAHMHLTDSFPLVEEGEPEGSGTELSDIDLFGDSGHSDDADPLGDGTTLGEARRGLRGDH